MNENAVMVLYYHRINSPETDINLLSVSQSQFAQQMKFLKKNYIMLRFEDDWSLLDGPGAVITFDDGYLDNYENALPILEELEIPATIFVSTGTMNQNHELWWDELEHLLLADSDIPEKFHLKDETFEYTWSTDTYEMRINCYRSLHFLMKNCISVVRRNKWFDQLWEWRKMPPYARHSHLTVNDSICRELAASKYITIGAHTVSHPALAKLSAREQKQEISLSVEYLSQLLSQKVDMFSYPFGAWGRDFNQETVAVCQELGIRKAASTIKGLWHAGDNNGYAIPRNCVRNWNLFQFQEIVKKLWEEVG